MALRQRDYILRMIEQLAEALGAIAGLRKAGKHDEAAQLWQSTADGLFGPLLTMLERLDAASAAVLVADRDKLLAYAALVAERAALSAARRSTPGKGQPGQSCAEHRRALELYLEAASEGAALDRRALDTIVYLSAQVDHGAMDPRYRAVLDRLDAV